MTTFIGPKSLSDAEDIIELNNTALKRILFDFKQKYIEFSAVQLTKQTKMVLEHSGLPNFQNAAGLQPALQLYAAAAAAQLSPRNRGVPPWGTFLQFGVPGVFGSPFFNRPRFGPNSNGQAGLAALSGLSALGANGLGNHQVNNNNRTVQGPPSEDSNEDRGLYQILNILLLI